MAVIVYAIVRDVTLIDGLLIGLLMPVDAVFVLHAQIAARPLFAFSLRLVRHLVVDSNSPLAIKQIVKLVETRQPVVIYTNQNLI